MSNEKMSADEVMAITSEMRAEKFTDRAQLSNHVRVWANQIDAAVAALIAERDALREDAERLNWIDATGFSDYRQWDAKTGLSGHCIVISEGGRKLGGGPIIPAGIRATIDAARANEST